MNGPALPLHAVGDPAVDGVTKRRVPVVPLGLALVSAAVSLYAATLPNVVGAFPSLLFVALPFVAHAIAVSSRRFHGGPGYWLILAFGVVNLTINPVLGAVLSMNLKGFDSVPTASAMTTTSVLQAVVFTAGLVGYYSLSAPSPRLSRSRPRLALGVVLLGLGFVGSWLRIDSLGGVSAYLSGQSVFDGGEPGDAGWLGLATTVLPCFWVAGWMVVWDCRPALFVGLRRWLLILVAILPMFLYSFNRAAVVVTLASMVLAATAAPEKPIRRVTIMCAGALLAIGTWIWGEWRNGFWATAGGRRIIMQTDLIAPDRSVWDVWQVYTASLPRAASALEIMVTRDATLLNSFLGAIPGLGRSWRPGSGPLVYNEALYGSGGAVDQILPAFVEAHASLPWVAPILLFLVVGVLLRRFEPTPLSSVAQSYFGWYFCIWILAIYVFSVSVVMQIVVFFLWPALFYWAWRRVVDR